MGSPPKRAFFVVKGYKTRLFLLISNRQGGGDKHIDALYI